MSLPYAKMQWDYQRLVADASSWESGRRVNWTQVAKEYGVHQPFDKTKLAVNGGQIVRAVLKDAKIDTSKFLNAYGKPTESPHARRAMQRTKSGIAVPMHTPLDELEKKKEEMYKSGLVCQSIRIVQKEYTITRFRTASSLKKSRRLSTGKKFLFETSCS